MLTKSLVGVHNPRRPPMAGSRPGILSPMEISESGGADWKKEPRQSPLQRRRTTPKQANLLVSAGMIQIGSTLQVSDVRTDGVFLDPRRGPVQPDPSANIRNRPPPGTRGYRGSGRGSPPVGGGPAARCCASPAREMSVQSIRTAARPPHSDLAAEWKSCRASWRPAQASAGGSTGFLFRGLRKEIPVEPLG